MGEFRDILRNNTAGDVQHRSRWRWHRQRPEVETFAAIDSHDTPSRVIPLTQNHRRHREAAKLLAGSLAVVLNSTPRTVSAMADNDSSKSQPEYVSITQAALTLGCSTRTIRRRISDGTLSAQRFGPRLIRVRQRDLDASLRTIPNALAA